MLARFISIAVSLIVAQSSVAAPAPASTSPAANQFPNPEPCYGMCSDPVHGLQDTTVAQSANGTFYRFSAFNNISIATAPHISGPWTSAGRALPGGSRYPLPGNSVGYWAPDVHEYQGTYYMYYTIQNYHSKPAPAGPHADIYVATSTNLRDWTDHGSIGLPHNRPVWSNIGGNAIFNGTSTPYLSWGSYSYGIYGVGLDSPPLKVDVPKNDPNSPNITKLISDIPLPAYPAGQGNKTEGSYKFAHGGYIYLFTSRGDCCSNDSNKGILYRVEVCRSKAVSGPYVNQNGQSCLEKPGMLVLASHGDVVSPGGVGVINTTQEGIVLFYQYHNKTIGYTEKDFQWGWNHLDFSSGWPKVVAGSASS